MRRQSKPGSGLGARDSVLRREEAIRRRSIFGQSTFLHFRFVAEYILSSIDQGVAAITLNRPDVLNSFNKRMHEELRDALGDASKNADVRAVMLTGAGRGFCAGQDLSEATAGVRN